MLGYLIQTPDKIYTPGDHGFHKWIRVTEVKNQDLPGCLPYPFL